MTVPPPPRDADSITSVATASTDETSPLLQSPKSDTDDHIPIADELPFSKLAIILLSAWVPLPPSLHLFPPMLTPQ